MDIEKKIDELKAQVRENLAERDRVYLSLGELLLKKPPVLQESGLLEEQRSTAEEHKKRIPHFLESIEEIQNNEEELKGLKEAENDLKKRKAENKEEMESMQDSLGEELYHLLNTLDSPSWAQAYEPVTAHINKMRDTESDLFQNENQASKKSLFNNMVFKSRISLLKNKKKTLESGLEKLYRKSFLDAVDLGAGAGGSSTPDGSLLVPWFRAVETWKALEKEGDDLENRKRLLKDRQKELCDGKGPKKRIDALRKEIEREEEYLKDALIKLGESICGNRSDEIAKAPSVSKLIGKIDELTEAGIALNLEIEKWQARIEIDKLENDKEYMSKKIDTLEEEIQARKQEIKVLKKDITQINRDIEKKQEFSSDLPDLNGED